MAVLRLFASIRVAAGTGKTIIPGNTVGEIVDAANTRFGQLLQSYSLLAEFG